MLFLMALALCCSCGSNAKVSSTPTDDTISIGYGSVDKDDNNSAVSKVKTNRKTVETYTNMYDYLAGKVPGVNVYNDRIIIRGIGTNSGNTDPLILVDGVRVDDISSLDPNLVDSVEVLKDGSASIYGAESANGVIMITLKK